MSAKKRGFTLIEAMISVAVMGIVAAGAVDGAAIYRTAGKDALLRERARQVLEAEADAIVARKPLPDGVREKLVAELPGGEFARTSADGVAYLKVWWNRAAGGRAELDLAVLEGK